MNREYTAQELDKLKNDFNLLNSIEEKFNFWIKRLRIPFCLWYRQPYEVYSYFMIKSQYEIEIEKINKLMFEEYSEMVESIAITKKIYQLEQMQEDFLKKYDVAPNQKKILELEISEIIDKVKTNDGIINDNFNYIGSYFKLGYNLEEEPNLRSKVFQIDHLIELKNGYTISRYRNFLDELVNKRNKKTVVFTHVEQVLILNYFGIIDPNTSASKKAEIFAPLIGRDSETTRQLLSEIEKKKTEKNLSVVLEYFKKIGLKDKIQLIENEMIKIKRRKK